MTLYESCAPVEVKVAKSAKYVPEHHSECNRGWGLGRGGRIKDENDTPVEARVRLLRKMGLGTAFCAHFKERQFGVVVGGGFARNARARAPVKF